MKGKKIFNSSTVGEFKKFSPDSAENIFNEQICIEETKSTCILKNKISNKTKNDEKNKKREILKKLSDDFKKVPNQESTHRELETISKQIQSSSNESVQEIIFLDEKNENNETKKLDDFNECKKHSNDEMNTILIKKPPKNPLENGFKKQIEKNRIPNNSVKQTTTIFNDSNDRACQNNNENLLSFNNKGSFDIQNSVKEYRERISEIPSENDYFIISSSDDETGHNKDSINNKNSDLNDLLEKFVSIRLESVIRPSLKVNQSEKKKIPSSINFEKQNSGPIKNKNENEKDEFLGDSPLPFLMRMKKCCKDASIFKN
jgi:hypothetical protein